MMFIGFTRMYKYGYECLAVEELSSSQWSVRSSLS